MPDEVFLARPIPTPTPAPKKNIGTQRGDSPVQSFAKTLKDEEKKQAQPEAAVVQAIGAVLAPLTPVDSGQADADTSAGEGVAAAQAPAGAVQAGAAGGGKPADALQGNSPRTAPVVKSGRAATLQVESGERTGQAAISQAVSGTAFTMENTLRTPRQPGSGEPAASGQAQTEPEGGTTRVVQLAGGTSSSPVIGSTAVVSASQAIQAVSVPMDQNQAAPFSSSPAMPASAPLPQASQEGKAAPALVASSAGQAAPVEKTIPQAEVPGRAARVEGNPAEDVQTKTVRTPETKPDAPAVTQQFQPIQAAESRQPVQSQVPGGQASQVKVGKTAPAAGPHTAQAGAAEQAQPQTTAPEQVVKAQAAVQPQNTASAQVPEPMAQPEVGPLPQPAQAGKDGQAQPQITTMPHQAVKVQAAVQPQTPVAAQVPEPMAQPEARPMPQVTQASAVEKAQSQTAAPEQVVKVQAAVQPQTPVAAQVPEPEAQPDARPLLQPEPAGNAEQAHPQITTMPQQAVKVQAAVKAQTPAAAQVSEPKVEPTTNPLPQLEQAGNVEQAQSQTAAPEQPLKAQAVVQTPKPVTAQVPEPKAHLEAGHLPQPVKSAEPQSSQPQVEAAPERKAAPTTFAQPSPAVSAQAPAPDLTQVQSQAGQPDTLEKVQPEIPALPEQTAALQISQPDPAGRGKVLQSNSGNSPETGDASQEVPRAVMNDPSPAQAVEHPVSQDAQPEGKDPFAPVQADSLGADQKPDGARDAGWRVSQGDIQGGAKSVPTLRTSLELAPESLGAPTSALPAPNPALPIAAEPARQANESASSSQPAPTAAREPTAPVVRLEKGPVGIPLTSPKDQTASDQSNKDSKNENHSGDETQKQVAKKGIPQTAYSTDAAQFRPEMQVVGKQGISQPAKPDLPVIQQVIERIQEAVQQGRTTLRLQLNPKDLGAIDVRLVSNGQTVSITMTAEHPATSQLLERQMDQLRANLTGAGINLANVNIGHPSTNGQQGGNFNGQPAPQRFVEGGKVTTNSQAETGLDPYLNRASTDSRIDYRI